MKILILASDSRNPSTMKLTKASQKQGAKVQVLSPLEMGLQLSPALVFDKKGPIKKPDFMLPRLGWETYAEGLKIVRAFEAMGVPCINSSLAIENSHNKLSCHSLLEKAHLPQPRTWYAARPFVDFFSKDFPNRCHIKLLQGSQGMGVSWSDSRQQLQAQIDLLRAANIPFLIQETLPGTEVRAFVVGKEVIAAMERHPAKGEKRSNLFQGGNAKITTLTEYEEEIVLAATHALHMNYAGVDFIRRGKKMWILEINAFPGMEGIMSVSKINVAEKIMKAVIP